MALELIITARNLKHLALGWECSPNSQRFLTDLMAEETLPGLRSIRLEHMDYIFPHILPEFIALFKGTLRSVDFRYVYLKPGSWETVMAELREKVPRLENASCVDCFVLLPEEQHTRRACSHPP
jgi:hypothetical protein